MMIKTWTPRILFVALCLAGVWLTLMDQGVIGVRTFSFTPAPAPATEGLLTVRLPRLSAAPHVFQDGRELKGPIASLRELSAAPVGSYARKGERLYIKGLPDAAASFVWERRQEVPSWLLPLVSALAAAALVLLLRPRPAPAIAPGQKLTHLDGLRGCACTVVVLFHAYNAFVVAEPGHTETVSGLMRVFPFGIGIGGSFAVEVFFVLSGFVLALPYLKGDVNDRLRAAMVRRPFRLLGLIIPAMVVAYLLGYRTEPVTAGTFVRDLCTSPFSRSWIYDPPLWSLENELYGSLGLFTGLWITQGMGFSRRVWFYAWAAVMCHDTWYMGFIAGAVLAEGASAGLLPVKSRGWLWVVSVATAAGLWLAVFSNLVNFMASPAGPVLTWLNWLVPFTLCAAVLVVYGALNSGSFAAFLKARPFQFLGRISYAMYVIHWMVLYSVVVPLISWSTSQLGWAPALAWPVALCLYLALTMGVALAVTRWIDEPAIRGSRWLADRLLSNVTRKKRGPAEVAALPEQA